MIRAAMRLLALAASLECSGCGTPRHSLTAEVEAALKEGKPLVADFWAAWCAPCKVFDDRVLPDPRVQAALGRVRFVRYDIDTTAGRHAFALVGGGGIPLFVALDASGEIRLLKRGQEPSADAFLAFLSQVQRVLGPSAARGSRPGAR